MKVFFEKVISMSPIFVVVGIDAIVTRSVYIWTDGLSGWTNIQIYVIFWALWLVAFYWVTKAERMSEWIFRTVSILTMIPFGVGITIRLTFNSGFSVWKLIIVVPLVALMISPLIGGEREFL